jgi:hypothetical protein
LKMSTAFSGEGGDATYDSRTFREALGVGCGRAQSRPKGSFIKRSIGVSSTDAKPL